jgi:uncharacterized protein (DUF885 family)
MKKILIALCFLSSILLLARYSDTQTSGSADLKAIADDYWKHQLDESLYLRLKFGLPIEKLPDISPEGEKKDTDFAQSILDRLTKIDAKTLTDEDSITYDMLKWENSATVEAHPYFWLTSPVTPYSSQLPTVNRAFREFTFKDARDMDRYLSLLKQYAGMIQTAQKHVQEQLKQGIYLPKEEVQLVVPFLKSYAKDPATNPMAVNEDRLKLINDKAKKDTFRQQADQILQALVIPNLNSLADYIAAGTARDNVGLSNVPNGKEYYRFLVRYHTTMNVTPEEIHQIGLKQIEEINQELDKIRQSLNFNGDLAAFRKSLKSDPKFFPKTPDEIGSKLMEYISRIEPELKKYFINVPKAPYGVKRLDPSLEGAMTFGYYQTPVPEDPKGYYYYNGSNLQQRSLLWAGSLIYHELVPGHHYQICLQEENTSLPEFRRESFPTAYVEGWGEYSSTIAGEMGMYKDDYDRAGRLAMKAFLTSRLVVDTGMNLMGWSRAKAMQFMQENLLISDSEIQTETLRYSSDIPGQALAYRMGCNKLVELREKSRNALKDRFDIREFHNAVLASGAMPFSVLEKHIDRYIAKSK